MRDYVFKAHIDNAHHFLTATVSVEEQILSSCKIDYCPDSNSWEISEWKTASDAKHQGWGKEVLGGALREMLKEYGKPTIITYIWNGQNQYVYDWIDRNFQPVCQCPIAVLKYKAGDCWDAHKYDLNISKVFEYFKMA